ncbi:MAG: YfhO family protein [Pseudomonadota bacterium]
MSLRLDFRAAVVLVLGWLVLVLVTPIGLYLIDEAVQLASVSSFVKDGSFVFDNGYDTYASVDLLFLYMVPGPDGPVAQYPAGYTLIAAPFYALGGIRGLYLLNWVSAIGCLWLTHRLALILAGPAVARRATVIFGLCTFFPFYINAIWPHALSLFCAMGMTVGAVICGRSESLRLWPALLGGAAFGLGLTIRVDILLLIPALGAWLILFAPRPYLHALLAGLGAAPFVLASAYLNDIKFGTFQPVTYGTYVGGTSFDGHIPTLIALIGAAIFLLAWRHLPRQRGALAIAAGAICILGAVLSARVLGFLQDVVWGLYVLVIDLSAFTNPEGNRGVVDTPEGWKTFWGLFKKALGQSLPWLGALVLLRLVDRSHRSGIVLALLVAAAVILPFAAREWHGGYAPNLRYFLYAVPLLCYLAALAWGALTEIEPLRKSTMIRTIFATALLITAIDAWNFRIAGHLFEHLLPPLLLAALALTCAIVVIRRQASQAVWALLLAAFTLSTLSVYMLDLRQGLWVRGFSNRVAGMHDLAPAGAVLYDNFSQSYWKVIEDRDRIAAISGLNDDGVDPDFVRRAILDGSTVASRIPDMHDRIEAALADVPLTREHVRIDEERVYIFYRKAP